jgi:hypothetical protein
MRAILMSVDSYLIGAIERLSGTPLPGILQQ